tara:strand:+ start:64 stop:480 length:417 start_codon:yes stop_codon:yes gene_type:complete
MLLNIKSLLHSSRAVLALNGGLMVILGGAFWLLPDFFTLAMFPHISENDTAIDVANALRKNMGAGCVFVGVILFACQDSSKYTAQRLLFSSAVGFLLMFGALLHMRISGQASVPIFILLFFGSLSLLSLLVASRRYQE